MGTPIGFFADDTPQDYPELNKCPDCETYFQTPCCPLCGKECPENMRAGNRAPVRVKRSRRRRGNGRVRFVPWYMSAWFIIAMLIIFPIVGLILLWQSDWRQGWKIAATILTIVGYLIGGGVLGTVLPLLDGLRGEPEPTEEPDVTQAAYAEPYAWENPVLLCCAFGSGMPESVGAAGRPGCALGAVCNPNAVPHILRAACADSETPCDCACAGSAFASREGHSLHDGLCRAGRDGSHPRNRCSPVFERILGCAISVSSYMCAV